MHILWCALPLVSLVFGEVFFGGTMYIAISTLASPLPHDFPTAVVGEEVPKMGLVQSSR